MIGSIIPTIGALPAGCLWCEGQTVNVLDYPELATAIDPQFVDFMGIHIPDLRGRFLYGSSDNGNLGGEAAHTLTLDEIPSHNHNAHTHLTGEGTGEILTPIPDLPVPDPLSFQGGGLAHNNLPPYFTIRFYIVAQ